MDSENIYENVQCRDFQDSTEPQAQNENQDEGNDRERRRCRYVVLAIVGFICALLLLFITLWHKSITAERDLLKTYKNTVEELNHTLQHSNTDLKTDKHQLEDKYNSLSLEKHQLEDKYNSLSLEKHQLEDKYNSLSLEKLQLETRVSDLNAEKNQLQNNVNSLSLEKLELETKVTDLDVEKNQLQNNFNSLNQTKLEFENNITSMSAELKKAYSKHGVLFILTEAMSWSESRQFCRDRGADLVIIKSEEKQRFISSLVKEKVWIGLSDIETGGTMKWVDNSTLNQGFWSSGEPNDPDEHEDCVELQSTNPVLNNWNDELCSKKRRFICEK